MTSLSLLAGRIVPVKITKDKMFSCDCQCFVSLLQGVVGWSEVYHCGTSWSYSLIFVHCIFIAEKSQFRRRKVACGLNIFTETDMSPC